MEDSAQLDFTGCFFVCNFHVSGMDTIYHYYAGTSNSCIDYETSMPIGVDSIYDRISISEVKWFKFRFNQDSFVTINSKLGTRKYYELSYRCQKGKRIFYCENDTLFKLNPYQDTLNGWGLENFNYLPIWIPYPLKIINQNTFEVQNAYPPFYWILKHEDMDKVKTIFIRAKITFENGYNIWKLE